MKKLNFKIVILLVAVVAVIAAVAIIKNEPEDYASAYEKTNVLTSYTMDVSTIVTVNDSGNIKQSTIDQNVAVENKGKSTMRYKVTSDSTSADLSTGKVIEESSSYIYYNKKYYQSYPGVNYTTLTDALSALENITSFTNIIAFAPDKMYNAVTVEEKGRTVFEYQVDYKDVSPYIQSTLTNAIGVFEDGNFKMESIWASATVKRGLVRERSFYIEYTDGEEKSVMVEVYTTLTDTSATVEIPDESKYVSITG